MGKIKSDARRRGMAKRKTGLAHSRRCSGAAGGRTVLGAVAVSGRRRRHLPRQHALLLRLAAP